MYSRLSPQVAAICLPIIFLCILTSCTDDNSETPNIKQPALSSINQSNEAPLIKNHALHRVFITKSEIVFSALRDSAIALEKSISSFKIQPTEESLNACRKQLNRAHKNYLSSYIFRNALSHANILDPDLDLQHLGPEIAHTNNIRLDQYPILPGYIDSVTGYPSSGLVHSEHALTHDFLNTEHQFSDKAYVAIGFHALAYLLHGGELESKRTSSSFKLEGTKGALEQNDISRVRRLQYVALLGELILSDVNLLYQSWVSDTGFYRLTLNSLPEVEMTKLLKRTIEIEKFSLPKLKQTAEDHPGDLAHNSLEIYELRRQVLESLENPPKTSTTP